jgi:AcrR family transcriptional regulator
MYRSGVPSPSTPYSRDVPSTRASYHHGALRQALLSASLQLIEAEGIGAVSLRRVARAAGVSPGAPYHHFPDRASLLAALSAQGFQLLAGELAAARAAAATPAHALTALVRTYVTFAQQHPAYFRLMFRPELSEPQNHPDAKAAVDAASSSLEETVADCVRAGVIPAGQADALAVTAWGLGHGLASLWLDGELKDSYDDPETMTAEVTALLETLLTTSQRTRSEPPPRHSRPG